MRFEWDPKKNRDNIRKHGLDFTTAGRIFSDSFMLTIPDVNHSVDEEREISMGLTPSP